MPSALMEVKREGCVIWRANLLKAAEFVLCLSWFLTCVGSER